MKVKYISHMGSDLTVVNAARASFNKRSTGYLTRADINLIKYLARGYSDKEWNSTIGRVIQCADLQSAHDILWSVKNKATHFAPFTHPQLSIQVTAPLAIARQLWRSHIGCTGGDSGYAAWSEESRRYLDDVPNVYEPHFWRKRAESLKQGSSDALFNPVESEVLTDEYLDLAKYSSKVYSRLIKEEVAPEQARLALLCGAEVTWTWTGSLMFFTRVASLRSDTNAQRENLDIVNSLASLLREHFPVSFEALRYGDTKVAEDNLKNPTKIGSIFKIIFRK